MVFLSITRMTFIIYAKYSYFYAEINNTAGRSEITSLLVCTTINSEPEPPKELGMRCNYSEAIAQDISGETRPTGRFLVVKCGEWRWMLVTASGSELPDRSHERTGGWIIFRGTPDIGNHGYLPVVKGIIDIVMLTVYIPD